MVSRNLNEKPRVVIKNWRVHEYMSAYLTGLVYGHPEFDDGTDVYTSNIQKISKKEDEWLVETRNTIYVCRLEDRA